MESAKNQITFAGMKPSRTFTKLIARSVEKWIQRERSLLLFPNPARYHAHIDKEDRHYFTCHIEIQIGAKEWSGLDEGRSVLEATLNALKRLRPKNLVELYGPTYSPAQVWHEASA